MWALGVCAYALMSGYLPFDEMEPPEPGCEIEWIVQFPEGKSKRERSTQRLVLKLSVFLVLFISFLLVLLCSK
jgi:hypothetical protein